jgi:hypothetical protein
MYTHTYINIYTHKHTHTCTQDPHYFGYESFLTGKPCDQTGVCVCMSVCVYECVCV